MLKHILILVLLHGLDHLPMGIEFLIRTIHSAELIKLAPAHENKMAVGKPLQKVESFAHKFNMDCFGPNNRF